MGSPKGISLSRAHAGRVFCRALAEREENIPTSSKFQAHTDLEVAYQKLATFVKCIYTARKDFLSERKLELLQVKSSQAESRAQV